MSLHEYCSEMVNWAGNCPEITVGSWIVSSILMAVNAVYVARRVIFGKTPPATVEVVKPVNVPYIPTDTVLKVLKLLDEAPGGWEILEANRLNYGSLSLYRDVSNRIDTYYKGIKINNKSFNPDLDQVLLRKAFSQRYALEQAKTTAKNEILASEKEKDANKELEAILDTI